MAVRDHGDRRVRPLRYESFCRIDRPPNPLHGGCKVRKGPKVAKFLDRKSLKDGSIKPLRKVP